MTKYNSNTTNGYSNASNNMDKVVHKELSYKITGLLFETHKELGRFKNEKQYADYFENLLKKEHINYKREYRFTCLSDNKESTRCICDFIIEDKIILEFKSKSFLTKEDYYQTKRYLVTLDKQLALIVNFRQYRLYPKRVLNKEYLKHSNEFEDSNYVKTNKTIHNTNGSAMLVTVMVLAVILVMALNAASVVMSGTIISGVQERSTLALYASEAGAERFLYDARRPPGLPPVGQANLYGTTTLSNNSYYVVDYGTSTPDVFATSTGSFLDTKRSIMLNF